MRPTFQSLFTAIVTASVVFIFAAMLPGGAALAGSKASARGAELFATGGCAHCHGAEGSGGDLGPDLKDVRKRLKSPAIAAQIHDGGHAMPAFGGTLSSAEIDDLVAYLRAKRKPNKAIRAVSALLVTPIDCESGFPGGKPHKQPPPL